MCHLSVLHNGAIYQALGAALGTDFNGSICWIVAADSILAKVAGLGDLAVTKAHRAVAQRILVRVLQFFDEIGVPAVLTWASRIDWSAIGKKERAALCTGDNGRIVGIGTADPMAA